MANVQLVQMIASTVVYRLFGAVRRSPDIPLLSITSVLIVRAVVNLALLLVAELLCVLPLPPPVAYCYAAA